MQRITACFPNSFHSMNITCCCNADNFEMKVKPGPSGGRSSAYCGKQVGCKMFGRASFDRWSRGYKAELRAGKRKEEEKFMNWCFKDQWDKGLPTIAHAHQGGAWFIFQWQELSNISRAETANSGVTSVFHYEIAAELENVLPKGCKAAFPRAWNFLLNLHCFVYLALFLPTMEKRVKPSPS